jgi:hypothetical protein
VKRVLGLQGVCDQVFTMQSGPIDRSGSRQPKAFWTRRTSLSNRCGVQEVLVWRHSPKRTFGYEEGSERWEWKPDERTAGRQRTSDLVAAR